MTRHALLHSPGEIFGGLQIPTRGNDVEALLAELTQLSAPTKIRPKLCTKTSDAHPEEAAADFPSLGSCAPPPNPVPSLRNDDTSRSQQKGGVHPISIALTSYDTHLKQRTSGDSPLPTSATALGTAAAGGVSEVLNRLRGPWAIAYWEAASRRLWFGRDAIGRRSLLVHWPDAADGRFLLASVSVPGAADGYWQVRGLYDSTLEIEGVQDVRLHLQ